MPVHGSHDKLIELKGWPKDAPPYSFSDADLGRESEENKAVFSSRAWDWVCNNEQQLLELEEEDSDGSVRLLEDSDDELKDGTHFLDLANFPVPAEPSSEDKAVVKKGVMRGARRAARRGARI